MKIYFKKCFFFKFVRNKNYIKLNWKLMMKPKNVIYIESIHNHFLIYITILASLTIPLHIIYLIHTSI